MDPNQDRDLLAFARATAADDTWSDAVRGQALLLVAKAGGKEDLDTLYGYLDSPSPLIQAQAMQAIAALESKVSAAAPRE
jgi:HEAT repeat protein